MFPPGFQTNHSAKASLSEDISFNTPTSHEPVLLRLFVLGTTTLCIGSICNRAHTFSKRDERTLLSRVRAQDPSPGNSEADQGCVAMEFLLAKVDILWSAVEQSASDALRSGALQAFDLFGANSVRSEAYTLIFLVAMFPFEVLHCCRVAVLLLASSCPWSSGRSGCSRRRTN